MRILKLYGGALLVLITSIVMAIVFFGESLSGDAETYNTFLLVCTVLIIVGIILMVVGGKSADKIGGK